MWWPGKLEAFPILTDGKAQDRQGEELTAKKRYGK